MRIVWIDHHRDPVNPPNPLYPNGMVVDLAVGLLIGDKCTVDLKYPAPRCGHWLIECEQCGMRIVQTTAGRKDDPCQIIIPCNMALKRIRPATLDRKKLS